MLFRRIANCVQLVGRQAQKSRLVSAFPSHTQPSTTGFGNRCYSDQNTEEATTRKEEKASREEKTKSRKRYALGGCLITMWFSTHAILLWRRRNEFRKLNEQIPPVDWKSFVEEYLAAGRVKSIVFQPNFEVADVYLYAVSENEDRQKAQHQFLATFRPGPEKFSRPPDVRFVFPGKPEHLELALKKALDDAECTAEFHFETNTFPSYRELAFIVISTVFTLAAIGLKK